MMIHQIWIGAEMPPADRADAERMRAACAVSGVPHRLWFGQDLWERYGNDPAVRELDRLRPHLPAARFAALAADWFRVRVLAEFGGVYFDTDIQLMLGHMPILPESADLYFFPDMQSAAGCSNCTIISCGERGKKAAARLAELSGQRLASIGIQECLGKDSLKQVIGASWLWAEAFPKLTEDGYNVRILPREFYSEHGGAAPLKHRDSKKWARTVGEPLPPQFDRRPEWQQTLPKVLITHFELPPGTRRVVLLANSVRGFTADDAGLREGDLVVHFSRALHRARAMELAPRSTHWLICRSGCERPRNWYTPESFVGFERVLFLDAAAQLHRCAFHRTYSRANPGRSPSTGFIAAVLFHTLHPDVPLLLAGFDPGSSHGAPVYEGHAWQYEAEWYAGKGLLLIKPKE